MHFQREVISTNLLSKYQYPVARILVYSSILDESCFYFIQEWVEGDLLLDCFHTFSDEKKYEILYDIGCTLGKLHTLLDEHALQTSNIWKFAYEEIQLYDYYQWRKTYTNQFIQWKNTIQFSSLEKRHGFEDMALTAMACFDDLTIETDHMALLHRDYGMRNILMQGKRVATIIDFEYSIIGDPIFDLSKLVFNDLNYNKDIEQKRAFFDGWKSITKQDIPYQRLLVYLALQGVGAIQWVDKQPQEMQIEHQGYRENGKMILKTALNELSNL